MCYMFKFVVVVVVVLIVVVCDIFGEVQVEWVLKDVNVVDVIDLNDVMLIVVDLNEVVSYF